MVEEVELVEIVVVDVVIKEVVVVAMEEVVQGVMTRGRGGPQANVVTSESGPQVTAATAGDDLSVTLTGEQVKQWEQWQKLKGSESSKTTSDGPMVATTSHFGNFANYDHLGKGTQA
jgi:hypothetical protein